MSQTTSRFTLVEDPPSAKQDAGTHILALALHALGQRAVAGISDAFSLILALCVLGLAYHVIDAPSNQQIGLVGLAALFALVFDGARRSSRKQKS